MPKQGAQMGMDWRNSLSDCTTTIRPGCSRVTEEEIGDEGR